MKNNNAVLEHYQEKFQHILVDEFQDTNELQYKWIKLFSWIRLIADAGRNEVFLSSIILIQLLQ